MCLFVYINNWLTDWLIDWIMDQYLYWLIHYLNNIFYPETIKSTSLLLANFYWHLRCVNDISITIKAIIIYQFIRLQRYV